MTAALLDAARAERAHTDPRSTALHVPRAVPRTGRPLCVSAVFRQKVQPRVPRVDTKRRQVPAVRAGCHRYWPLPSLSLRMVFTVESFISHTAFFRYRARKPWCRSMSSSAVISVALPVVTTFSPPPVAAKMPVGLPLPSPTRKTSSSAASIRRANSTAKYCSTLNAASFSSSSEILRKVPSLIALSVTCVKTSSDSVYDLPSSSQPAVPWVKTTGIFRSPLVV